MSGTAWILGKLFVFEGWANSTFITALRMTCGDFCVVLVSELCFVPLRFQCRSDGYTIMVWL